MPFANRVRLPIQLHSPQFPEERQVFRKANGQTKVQSVIIRKTYELETDYFPESWHQRLKIALSHDNVSIEAENFLGDISQDGDYNIEWIDNPLHYPAAKAGVKVQVTPFDATNSNCQTCEEASQLSLTDDEATGIYGALQEDQDYTVDAADNDTICCYPAVFSLVSFNTDYLINCTINPDTGVVSLHTGTGLTSANGVVIATYRVTCPDGSYDEADITADFDGTVEGCLAPEIDLTSSDTPTTVYIRWDEPIPGGTYQWELYEGSGPIGSPVQSGTITDDEMTLTGLTAETLYFFQIRTDCGGGNFSNWVSGGFSTMPEPPSGESCGTYNISYSAPPTEPPIHSVAYADCDANTTVVHIPNGSSRTVCALENSPGDPFLLSSSNIYVTITYVGIC